jgi:hypothetical protein
LGERLCTTKEIIEEDVINLAGFQLTYEFYDAGTANNVYYFVDGYRLINRCNLIMKKGN